MKFNPLLERNAAGKYWLHVSVRRLPHMNRHESFFKYKGKEPEK